MARRRVLKGRRARAKIAMDFLGTPAVVPKVSGKVVFLQAKRWHVLEIMAKAQGWRRVAELGVYKAWTTLHLLSALPDLEVVAVDRYVTPEGSGAEPGYTDYHGANMEALYRDVARKLAAYGDRVKLVREDTVEAARQFDNSAFDAVFIDADHRTEKALADIDAWWPKVRSKGWLLGHDWHWSSVRKAVFAHFHEGDVIRMPDNVWGVRK